MKQQLTEQRPAVRLCEDGILHSFVLRQYRRVTDGQTDRNTVSNTSLSIATRCKNVYTKSVKMCPMCAFKFGIRLIFLPQRLGISHFRYD